MFSNIWFIISIIFITKSICVDIVEKPAGSTVILSCSTRQHQAASSSSNHHIWWFNQQIIFFKDQFQPKDIGCTNVIGTLYNETFSILQIHEFEKSNEGVYTCFFDSNIISTFHLRVAGPIITKFVCRGTGVSLNCSLEGNHIWKFNNVFVVADSFRPSNIGLENVRFKQVSDTLSFLHIESIMIENAGNYSCAVIGESGESRDVRYRLIVQDTKVHLSIRGQNISELQYIISEVMYKITCTLSGNVGKKENSITLMTWQTSESPHAKSHSPATAYGSNTVTMTTMFASSTLESLFVCVGIDEYGNEFDRENRKLDIFVVPDLVIQMDGRNMSDRYYGRVGDMLNLTCVAFGSRPSVNLRWQNEKDKMTNIAMETSPNKYNEFANDTKILLIVGIEQGKVLTCLSKGVSESHTGEASLIIEVKSEVRYVAVVGSISATVILVVSFSIYLKLQRQKRENAELFALPVWQEATTSGANGEISTENHISMVSFDTFPEGDTLVPVSSEYSFTPVEGNNYGASSESFRMISHLHSGDRIEYWLGKYYSKDGDMDCICEVLSDNAQMKEGYNFVFRVKKLRDLQRNSNVVFFLGNSIEKMPYCLQREYVHLGTLRDYLLQNYNSHRQPDASRNTISIDLQDSRPHPIIFAADVACAMDFLHAHQFHHPSLSARKVLVNGNLVCKLFDFWPSELSTERATNLLKKAYPPIAWLPPETVFLDQYSRASDVWSYGILLWEIFSLGETPFRFKSSEEIENEIRNMNLLSQPPNCPGSVFSLMLSTWQKHPENRPSFTDIKERIKPVQEMLIPDTERTEEWNGSTIDYFTLETEQSSDVQYSLPFKC